MDIQFLLYMAYKGIEHEIVVNKLNLAKLSRYRNTSNADIYNEAEKKLLFNLESLDIYKEQLYAQRHLFSSGQWMVKIKPDSAAVFPFGTVDLNESD